MRTLVNAVNGPGHKWASLTFLGIVLAHWVEHIFQAIQVFVLDWPREVSRGALGLLYPWLATSEWLHYWYALVMFLGLALLRPAYVGRSRLWWDLALLIQVWHHFEHALLLSQALAGRNLFGSPVPVSVLQLVVPRVELHLFYNAVVFVPMLIATWYHVFPARESVAACHCPDLGAWSRRPWPIRP